MAKKAVDSTLRKIFNYTAEIIVSLILLVTICIPLAFTIPMWFQYVFFNIPRTELTINPVNWWGLDGTLWVTLLLGLVSLTLGYLYLIKIKPGDESGTEEDEEESVEAASDDLPTQEIDEVSEDDIALEDQEEEDESRLDDIMDSIEEEIDEEQEDESEEE